MASFNGFYPPSLRPALVQRREGYELFITLGTRNCSKAEAKGGCDFCGLGILDGQQPALSLRAAESQTVAILEQLRKQGLDP